ncbi:MAG: hypothetical protein RL722_2020 [Pseudomonadota bacterium]|jgi:formate dehydrogenase subunit gamma
MNAPDKLPAPLQPAAPAPEVLAAVNEALAAHAGEPGALLPILHAVQDRLGHVPPSAVPLIAPALNLSRAEVHGVITYYHHFRREPAGRHVLQVCRAESCQARGGEQLLAQARERAGCSGEHHTSPDGEWTVEPVYCLGLCSSSPAAQLGERLYARLTPAKLDALMNNASQAEVQA